MQKNNHYEWVWKQRIKKNIYPPDITACLVNISHHGYRSLCHCVLHTISLGNFTLCSSMLHENGAILYSFCTIQCNAFLLAGGHLPAMTCGDMVLITFLWQVTCNPLNLWAIAYDHKGIAQVAWGETTCLQTTAACLIPSDSQSFSEWRCANNCH